MKKYLIIILTFISILLLFNLTYSQSKPAEGSVDLDASIPIDSNIVYGQFENGLRYYIKVNKRPEDRAELRLAVNAGSVLEDDDQQGLAHFCEHMAFNGTKHFEKQEIIDYLESIGMKFGPEINAYTSFDETVYMLEVPTDSAEVMEKAFQILEDWARFVSYEPEEIDKERGVITEEWRLGRGAEARMRDEQFPILLQGSRYADRLPIGKMAVVDTCHYGTLTRFYNDWYRPDLMAVVAVGDFDVEWIKGLIEKHFAQIPPHASPREREIFPIPDHKETLFAIAKDPEAVHTEVSLYYKVTLLPETTVADYRRMIMENLHDYMMNQRLDELVRQADPPFIYGIAAKGSFLRSKGVYYLSAAVREQGIERGLAVLLKEAERVRRFGFTQTELDRAKKATLRYVEKAFEERDKTESHHYAAEYIRNFLIGEPIPGIVYEYDVQQQLMEGITLEEINGLIGQWILDKNRVILVNAPEKPDLQIPNESKLLAIFQQVEQQEILPYVDRVSSRPLIDHPPKPGKVVKTNKIKKLGVTEWTLSNGIKVVLKPTDFKNDEILFTAFSPGGNSLVNDSDFVSAITATAIIRESGVGQFNRMELEKRLSDKMVRVSPSIDMLTEGFSGSASPKDLETLFQLIYLYATSPRQDSTAYASYKTRFQAYIENRNAQPESAFNDTLDVTLTQYHPRSKPLTKALLEEMDFESIYRIYRERFADTDDFVFIFIGNFDLKSIKSLIETYLGSLPSLPGQEMWKDLGIQTPRGVINKEVRKGIEPKSLIEIVFTGPCTWTREENYNLNSMASVLMIKFREILREDLSGTYSTGVSGNISLYPREEYRIDISFGCAPERVEEMTRTVFLEIDSLKTVGPKSSDVEKVREMQLRQYEKGLKENRFWLSTLNRYYFRRQDPFIILTFPELVEKLSVQSIQETAQKYFDVNHYVRVVLYPENGSQNE